MDAKVFRAGVVTALYHQPVLLQPAVEGLVWHPSGVYVDATFGGGGHSRAILSRLASNGRLIGIDKDPDAPLHALADERFVGVRGDFRDIETLLSERSIHRVAGILADLGISSHQIDEPSRGFSYRWDVPLDLRMDPTVGLPAWAWLKYQHPEGLARLLRMYGDLPRSRRLADVILENWQPHFTTGQLVACAQKVYGKQASERLAPLFQAIRIAINGEYEALRALLEAATHLVERGGRLVILTYHSGEVRLVKAHLHRPAYEDPVTGQKQMAWRLLGKVFPSPAEVQDNPRSRSAILWIAEKL